MLFRLAYFGSLLARYQGSEAIALACYNAGEAPVRNWLRQRSGMALDAFVEEIPIQETRGYVKRVLRSFAAYRFLGYIRADQGANTGRVEAPPLAIVQRLPAISNK